LEKELGITIWSSHKFDDIVCLLFTSYPSLKFKLSNTPTERMVGQWDKIER